MYAPWLRKVATGHLTLLAVCRLPAHHQNIHVAHVILDGLIDSQTARDYLLGSGSGSDGDKRLRFPDKTVLLPDEVAKTYLFLAQQAPSAWTFEVDLRPAKEKF